MSGIHQQKSDFDEAISITGEATEATLASALAKLTTIDTTVLALNGIEVNVLSISSDASTIAGAVVAAKMQVDVITMPTVTATLTAFGALNLSNRRQRQPVLLLEQLGQAHRPSCRPDQ